MSNTVALANEQTCFCVLETTKGTAVFPSAAAQLVVGAGVIDINQQPTFSNSEEIVDSLDVIDRFQDQIGAGTFNIPAYIRPSGAAGTAPMAGVLFKSLMGLETVVGSTSVTYGQATTKPSFTLWVKKSHTVFFGTGACVDKGSLNMTNKGGAMITFSGGFMQMGWAGTDEVDGIVSGSTSVTVQDGKKFTAGAFVKIGSDDNTGAGYRIASVSGNVLTMDDSISCADEAVIAGWIPDSYSVVGAPLESKETGITIDGAAARLKSLNLDISSPAVYQVDEITTSQYAEDYVEDTRAITGSIDLLFRQDDLSLFYDGLNDVSKAIIATVGSAGGSICKITFPYAELEVPTVTSNKPTVDLNATLTALGSSGEDSATIAFT